MHPRPKQLLLRGALPCLAGLLAGQLIPWKTHPPATAARPQPAARGSSDATGTAPGVVAITSESMPPAAQDPPKPESTKERLKKLATNRRVEELLIEIQKLPPGAERTEGIGLLAKAWFPLDRSGTMKWIETLTNPEEQKAAYGNMLQSWCAHDTHASSAFVAALPDGELKNALGVGLSDFLWLREPMASLSWALAYPGKKSDERLKSTVQSAASNDYETTSGLISGSKLPDPEKQRLLKTARAAWNETKVLQGKWSEIKPEPTSPP